MTMTRLFRLAAFALLPLALGAQAQAPFPSKPITVIVPFAPGGTGDVLARTSAEILSKDLGQPVVVDSKPGAGGSLGMEYVVRAPADGHTLVLTTSGSMAINPYVYKLRYLPVDDLATVTILADVPFVFVANTSSGIKDLDGLRAKAKANPGGVSSGNAGSGTQAHLTQALFEKAAGISLNVIPYKGSAPGINDLLGRQIDTMIDNIASQANFIKAGKVQPLFVTSQKRSPVLPQVPTAEEAGLPGFSSVAWYGLAAPRNTPPEIVNRIQQSLAKGFARPEIQQKLEAVGLITVVSTPAESTERTRREYEQFGTVVRELKLKPM